MVAATSLLLAGADGLGDVGVLVSAPLLWLLPGLVLLDLIGLTTSLTPPEIVSASYVVSYLIMGWATLTTLPLSPGSRRVTLLVGELALGIVGIVKFASRRARSRPQPNSNLGPEEVAGLVALSAYHIALTLWLYPKLAYLPSLDMTRHYVASVILWRSPQIYGNPLPFLTTYPPFLRAHLGALIAFSGGRDEIVKLSLSAVSALAPITLYSTARSLLRSERVALLTAALLDVSLLTDGLEWVRVAFRGEDFFVSVFRATPFNVYQLGVVYDSRYMGLMLFCFLIWLLLSGRRLRRALTPMIAAAVAGLYLTHVGEAVAVAGPLAAYSLLSQKGRDLRPTLLGITAGLVMSAVAQILLDTALPFYTVSWQEIIVLGAMLGILSLSYALPGLGAPIIRGVTSGKRAVLLLSALFGLEVSGLILWATAGEGAGWANKLGVVPWYQYPVLLGLVGAALPLAVSAHLEWGDDRSKLILGLLVGVILLGRLVSLVNVMFFFTRFWEWRLIPLIKLLAVLAWAGGLELLLTGPPGGGEGGRRGRLRAVLAALMVSTLVLEAVPAFAGTAGLRKLAKSSAPSEAEIEVLRDLRLIFDRDPLSYPLTVTYRSLRDLMLADPPASVLPLSFSLDTLRAYTPEATLAAMYWPPPYTHPYLYVDKRRDLGPMGGTYVEGMLRNMRPAYESENALLYNLSRYSPVSGDGEVVALVPLDGLSPESLRLLGLLARFTRGLTTALFPDLGVILRSHTLILTFDPATGEGEGGWERAIPSLAMSFARSGGRVVVYRSGGRGFFSERMLEPIQGTIRATSVCVDGEEVPLPAPVEVPRSRPGEGVELLATYVGTGGEVPLVVAMDVGGGRIYLMNVEPLLSPAADSKGSWDEGILGLLLSISPTEPSQREVERNVRTLSYLGELRADSATLTASSAVLLPVGKVFLRAADIRLTVAPGSAAGLAADRLTLSVLNLSLGGETGRSCGSGLYVCIQASELSASAKNLRIWVVSPEGRTLEFSLGDTVIRIEGEGLMAVRTPEVMTEGRTVFEEPRRLEFLSYTASLLVKRRVIVEGGVEIVPEVVDRYLILRKVRPTPGSLIRLDPPLTSREEPKPGAPEVAGGLLAFLVHLAIFRRLASHWSPPGPEPPPNRPARRHPGEVYLPLGLTQHGPALQPPPERETRER